tara:strand:+ start:42 stop:203 length:162 start_codon:yes stop_codon:yes gene_type:complete
MREPMECESLESYVLNMTIEELKAGVDYQGIDIMNIMNKFQSNYINKKTLKVI